MHSSLIREIRDKYLAEMLPPPCGIIDFHMHIGNKQEDRVYARIAREYGIEQAGAMLHNRTAQELQDEFGDFYFPIVWLDMPEEDSGREWIEKEVARIYSMLAAGVKGLKLRSACKEGRPMIWIDNQLILEVLKEIEKTGILLYIHIADPSLWWGEKFDPIRVGQKIEYHRPVEHILQYCPELRVIGAHMGGYPEDLDFVGSVLDNYPNYYLDTSATKWIVRELGRDTDRTREFILKYQERICFGSDLVTFLSEGEEDYYHSRLWVLRNFFEGADIIPSMIIDPDAAGSDYPHGPEIRGLNLDVKVLRRIYAENAAGLLGNSTGK